MKELDRSCVEPCPRALLFDMDGTLTEPMLDFSLIRAEMAIDGPILESMAKMSGARLANCRGILARHEERAASESALSPGCRELLDFAQRHDIRSAVITRNSRQSVAAFVRRHAIQFSVVITRDDCLFKPDPQPLLLACTRLAVGPAYAWMIGDGRYDVEAAAAAKVRSVWISHGREISFDARPWRVVKDLIELQQLLASFSPSARSRV